MIHRDVGVIAIFATPESFEERTALPGRWQPLKSKVAERILRSVWCMQGIVKLETTIKKSEWENQIMYVTMSALTHSSS